MSASAAWLLEGESQGSWREEKDSERGPVRPGQAPSWGANTALPGGESPVARSRSCGVLLLATPPGPIYPPRPRGPPSRRKEQGPPGGEEGAGRWGLFLGESQSHSAGAFRTRCVYCLGPTAYTNKTGQ